MKLKDAQMVVLPTTVVNERLSKLAKDGFVLYGNPALLKEENGQIYYQLWVKEKEC